MHALQAQPSCLQVCSRRTRVGICRVGAQPGRIGPWIVAPSTARGCRAPCSKHSPPASDGQTPGCRLLGRSYVLIPPLGICEPSEHSQTGDNRRRLPVLHLLQSRRRELPRASFSPATTASPARPRPGAGRYYAPQSGPITGCVAAALQAAPGPLAGGPGALQQLGLGANTVPGSPARRDVPVLAEHRQHRPCVQVHRERSPLADGIAERSPSLGARTIDTAALGTPRPLPEPKVGWHPARSMPLVCVADLPRRALG